MTARSAGPKALFTPAALQDLEEIWDYIAEDSPPAATAVIDTLLTSVARLAEYPHIGHPRDDLADETLRVWPVYSYLIIYRPVPEPVEIIRIVSGFRELLALFPEE